MAVSSSAEAAGVSPTPSTPNVYLSGCPGESVPVAFQGFPGNSTWTLSSAHATFVPDTTSFDQNGVPTVSIHTTIAADAPASYDVTATPNGSGTAVVSTATTTPPAVGAQVVFDLYRQDRADCFAPGEMVDLSASIPEVHVPTPLVADSSGSVYFPMTAVAQPDAQEFTVTATSAVTGRSATSPGEVAATTLAAGTTLDDSAPGPLASSTLVYDLRLSACVVMIDRHELLSDGEHDFKIWGAGIGNGVFGCRLIMQTDGNLVQYSPSSKPVWSSGTSRTGAHNRAVLQTDGNFVNYTSFGAPVWSSVTGRSAIASGVTLAVGQQLAAGGSRLRVQTDGNVVLYHSGKAVWSTGTRGSGGNRLVMQTDGNLVLYTAAGKAVWSSRTAHTGSTNMFLVSGAGRASILTQSGTTIWHT